MKKIGITGSLASGKTTASQILTSGKLPLFSADKIVSRLYSKNNFRLILFKQFKIKKNLNLKNNIRKKILENKSNIKKLENIIHPIVRKEMYKFLKKNKKKKLFNLRKFVSDKLLDLNIQVDHIKRDTYLDKKNFFSYRRSSKLKQNDYGRCISVISLI